MSQWLCINGKWNCKTSPIQKGYGESNTSIPYEVAEEAYKEYSAQYGKQQTLERLNERGGFGFAELSILLYERIKRLESQVSSVSYHD